MTVVIFGSISVDHVAYVKSLPLPGETMVGEYRVFPGGKGGNQAVASARAGCETVILGAVNDDAAGKFMQEFLDNEGINATGVSLVDKPTGVALINVDEASQNAITVCPGANLEARVTESDLNGFDKGTVFLAQGETDIEALKNAFVLAKQKAMVTILNPAPFFLINTDILDNVDILIFNEIEFSQYVGSDKIMNAGQIEVKLGELGEQKVIVTLGAGGVVYINEGVVGNVNGVNVNAIDTTGAGDCFCGYFAARICTDWPFEKAVIAANEAAAVSVTRLGAASSIPKAGEMVDD